MLAAMAGRPASSASAFERVIVRPVYGQHLKQILITMGGMIIGEELIKVIWGPAQIPLPLPEALRGSFLVGDAAIEKFRLLAVVVGLVVFAALLLVLNRTKIGLLIRAGVQDREMVESARLPHPPPVRRRVRRRLGARRPGRRAVGHVPAERDRRRSAPQVNVLIFIVIIIGGLGSTTGCFVGALLVGLMANYVGFLRAEARACSRTSG